MKRTNKLTKLYAIILSLSMVFYSDLPIANAGDPVGSNENPTEQFTRQQDVNTSNEQIVEESNEVPTGAIFGADSSPIKKNRKSLFGGGSFFSLKKNEEGKLEVKKSKLEELGEAVLNKLEEKREEKRKALSEIEVPELKLSNENLSRLLTSSLIKKKLEKENSFFKSIREAVEPIINQTLKSESKIVESLFNDFRSRLATLGLFNQEKSGEAFEREAEAISSKLTELELMIDEVEVDVSDKESLEKTIRAFERLMSKVDSLKEMAQKLARKAITPAHKEEVLGLQHLTEGHAVGIINKIKEAKKEYKLSNQESNFAAAGTVVVELDVRQKEVPEQLRQFPFESVEQAFVYVNIQDPTYRGINKFEIQIVGKNLQVFTNGVNTFTHKELKILDGAVSPGARTSFSLIPGWGPNNWGQALTGTYEVRYRVPGGTWITAAVLNYKNSNDDAEDGEGENENSEEEVEQEPEEEREGDDGRLVFDAGTYIKMNRACGLGDVEACAVVTKMSKTDLTGLDALKERADRLRAMIKHPFSTQKEKDGWTITLHYLLQDIAKQEAEFKNDKKEGSASEGVVVGAGNLITKEINVNGDVTKYEWPETGELVITDPDGNVSKYGEVSILWGDEVYEKAKQDGTFEELTKGRTLVTTYDAGDGINVRVYAKSVEEQDEDHEESFLPQDKFEDRRVKLENGERYAMTERTTCPLQGKAPCSKLQTLIDLAEDEGIKEGGYTVEIQDGWETKKKYSIIYKKDREILPLEKFEDRRVKLENGERYFMTERTTCPLRGEAPCTKLQALVDLAEDEGIKEGGYTVEIQDGWETKKKYSIIYKKGMKKEVEEETLEKERKEIELEKMEFLEWQKAVEEAAAKEGVEIEYVVNPSDEKLRELSKIFKQLAIFNYSDGRTVYAMSFFGEENKTGGLKEACAAGDEASCMELEVMQLKEMCSHGNESACKEFEILSEGEMEKRLEEEVDHYRDWLDRMKLLGELGNLAVKIIDESDLTGELENELREAGFDPAHTYFTDEGSKIYAYFKPNELVEKEEEGSDFASEEEIIRALKHKVAEHEGTIHENQKLCDGGDSLACGYIKEAKTEIERLRKEIESMSGKKEAETEIFKEEFYAELKEACAAGDEASCMELEVIQLKERCAHGDESACKELKILSEGGIEKEINPKEEPYTKLKEACAAGDEAACMELEVMQLKERCAHGDESACIQLEKILSGGEREEEEEHRKRMEEEELERKREIEKEEEEKRREEEEHRKRMEEEHNNTIDWNIDEKKIEIEKELVCPPGTAMSPDGSCGSPLPDGDGGLGDIEVDGPIKIDDDMPCPPGLPMINGQPCGGGAHPGHDELEIPTKKEPIEIGDALPFNPEDLPTNDEGEEGPIEIGDALPFDPKELPTDKITVDELVDEMFDEVMDEVYEGDEELFWEGPGNEEKTDPEGEGEKEEGACKKYSFDPMGNKYCIDDTYEGGGNEEEACKEYAPDGTCMDSIYTNEVAKEIGPPVEMDDVLPTSTNEKDLEWFEEAGKVFDDDFVASDPALGEEEEIEPLRNGFESTEGIPTENADDGEVGDKEFNPLDWTIDPEVNAKDTSDPYGKVDGVDALPGGEDPDVVDEDAESDVDEGYEEEIVPLDNGFESTQGIPTEDVDDSEAEDSEEADYGNDFVNDWMEMGETDVVNGDEIAADEVIGELRKNDGDPSAFSVTNNGIWEGEWEHEKKSPKKELPTEEETACGDGMVLDPAGYCVPDPKHYEEKMGSAGGPGSGMDGQEGESVTGFDDGLPFLTEEDLAWIEEQSKGSTVEESANEETPSSEASSDSRETCEDGEFFMNGKCMSGEEVSELFGSNESTTSPEDEVICDEAGMNCRYADGSDRKIYNEDGSYADEFAKSIGINVESDSDVDLIRPTISSGNHTDAGEPSSYNVNTGETTIGGGSYLME